jgi:hypothetical protein
MVQRGVGQHQAEAVAAGRNLIAELRTRSLWCQYDRALETCQEPSRRVVKLGQGFSGRDVRDHYRKGFVVAPFAPPKLRDGAVEVGPAGQVKPAKSFYSKYLPLSQSLDRLIDRVADG